MADPKTTPTEVDPRSFIQTVQNKQRREDALKLLRLFEEVTGMKAVMWGPSIIGYGSYHYRYASGREGDWMLTGFSPRKQNMTVYIMTGFDKYGDLLEQLGKHKTSVSCLYFNTLEDIDVDILKQLIAKSVALMQSKYETTD
ncbi:DUF1801 domain-containing protein [Croceiramulus getboli]|nr:DUF1801 domain-containing protein [Flavobacteriaceae bacterium YJPT1-3]